jgi:hypothetical protein
MPHCHSDSQSKKGKRREKGVTTGHKKRDRNKKWPKKCISVGERERENENERARPRARARARASERAREREREVDR